MRICLDIDRSMVVVVCAGNLIYKQRVRLKIRRCRQRVVVVRKTSGHSVLRLVPDMVVVLKETRISHCCRTIWYVCSVMPIRPERPLVIRDGGSERRLERRTHSAWEMLWTAVHLVGKKRLEWWDLVEHGVQLGQLLPYPA